MTNLEIRTARAIHKLAVKYTVIVDKLAEIIGKLPPQQLVEMVDMQSGKRYLGNIKRISGIYFEFIEMKTKKRYQFRTSEVVPDFVLYTGSDEPVQIVIQYFLSEKKGRTKNAETKR